MPSQGKPLKNIFFRENFFFVISLCFYERTKARKTVPTKIEETENSETKTERHQ